jgi:MYXO-CTERM domain-containing protein
MRPSRLLAALALTAPALAWATPDFPAAIARDLQLSAPPPCTICHATDAGGSGTVVKPFGKYLVSRGLVPFDEASLARALAAAAGENHDSDGDGISDIEVLRRGLDPNGSAAGASSLEDPTFGCSTGRGGGSTWFLVLLVGLGLAAARARRRTARP